MNDQLIMLKKKKNKPEEDERETCGTESKEISIRGISDTKTEA